MMKKSNILVLIVILFYTIGVSAQDKLNMQNLFDALKENPIITGDSLALQNIILGKKQVKSNLRPKIEGFSTYTYGSTPNGLVPIPPNEILPLVQNQSIAQPFSKNIYRIGANISMPIFVKSIFTTGKKMNALINSATVKNKINLLQKEAIIVGANANLQYMDALIEALNTKKSSLNITKEIVTIKVNSGKIPGSALLILNSGINQIDITINEIKINREAAIETIQNLTNIRLEKAIEMDSELEIKEDSILIMQPLQHKLIADKMAIKSEKEHLWPALYLNGNFNYGLANAYNNDQSVGRNYYTVGVVLKIPIYNQTQNTKIKQTKLNYKTTENKLEKLKLETLSHIDKLKNSLMLTNKSISLYKESITQKKELLDIAKKSYQLDRITVNEYLDYENDLVFEKSKLYLANAKKWQDLMQLAVIFGNNIENTVK